MQTKYLPFFLIFLCMSLFAFCMGVYATINAVQGLYWTTLLDKKELVEEGKIVRVVRSHGQKSISMRVFFILNSDENNEYRQSLVEFFYNKIQSNDTVHVALNEGGTHYLIKEYKIAYLVTHWIDMFFGLLMFFITFLLSKPAYLFMKEKN